jgi:type I restriction enzyme S subunit
MSLLEGDLGDREWLRVGDCYEVTKKPRDLDRFSVSEIPFAAMEAIPQDGTYTPSFVPKAPHAITSGTYFERGDILVAKITPSFENGKQALVLKLPAPFGYATTEVIPLRPRGSEHDPRLLFFYLLHPDIRHHVAERMEGTTGRQRVPEDVLLDLPIPDFDRDEQTAIADALEAMRRASAAEGECERLGQKLKRAAMRELFTRGLRGEAQKETEIGTVPGSWAVKPIGRFTKLSQYGLSIRGCATGRYPILRMNCQEDGRVVLRDLQYVDLDETTAQAFRVNRGDILFNRTNSYELVGRTAIVDDDIDAVFASYLIRLSIDDERLLLRYLSYFLNWDFAQSELKKLASRAVGQANINATKLSGFAIPVPTPDEQREIVAILDAIDRKIDLHRQKRAVLDELFRALLHKSMTGEVRIADLNLSALAPIAVAEAAQ